MSRTFPQQFLRLFIEITTDEVGQENLFLLLEKASLPVAWANIERIATSDGHAAAEAYAGLQKALRTYYGRGARGILQRAGSLLWKRLLEEASIRTQVYAALVRKLPTPQRPKAALELLASLISSHLGDVTVHTLDRDLLLADHASPGAPPRSADEPICFVTLGLLRECLLWADGKQYDIQETSCRATGQEACEFTIKTGGSS